MSCSCNAQQCVPLSSGVSQPVDGWEGASPAEADTAVSQSDMWLAAAVRQLVRAVVLADEVVDREVVAVALRSRGSV